MRNTFWQFLSKTFWPIMTNLETLFSFLAMVFAGYVSLRLWRQNRQLRDLARGAPKIENFQENAKFWEEDKRTTNPVALAISLVPQAQSIKKDVEDFLNTKGWKMPVEEIRMEGINNLNGVENFINTLREKRQLFDLQGVTEVRLFFQGPVMAGVLVGAMYDHWKPVLLYQKYRLPHPMLYEYWGILTK